MASSAAYDRSSVHKTEEEIQAAKTVNLPDFLRSIGYPIKRVGSSYQSKEHDSLSIKDNSYGEVGMWYQFSRGKGGNNIQFLQEFVNPSLTFSEAVDMLNNGRVFSRTYEYPRKSEKAQDTPKKHAEITIDEAKNKDRAIAYLTEKRGLKREIFQPFLDDGSITENKWGNVVFCCRDENGKLVGANKIVTDEAFKKQSGKGKFIERGSDGMYGFEIQRGNGDTAYFFESEIDALSFLQLHNEELNNCLLVSMMGVKHNLVKATMERHNIPAERVYICSDNDEAGNDCYKRLTVDMGFTEMKRLKPPQDFKDWNDVIRNIPITVLKGMKEKEKNEMEQNDSFSTQEEQEEQALWDGYFDGKAEAEVKKKTAEVAPKTTPPQTKSQEPQKSKATMMNADYYKEYKALPDNKKFRVTLPGQDACNFLNKWKNEGIPFAAYGNRADKITIMTSRDNGDLVEAMKTALSEVSQTQSSRSKTNAEHTSEAKTESKSSDAINPDYYKLLGKENRVVTPFSADVGKKVMENLNRQGVEYSAVRRQNGDVAVTVSKSDKDALDKAANTIANENTNENVKSFLYIDKEYYMSLPQEQRFTRRMNESDALATAHKLADNGIRCSATLGGEKSAVTISKADYFRDGSNAKTCFPERKAAERADGLMSHKSMNKAAKVIHNKAVDKNSKDKSRDEQKKNNPSR